MRIAYSPKVFSKKRCLQTARLVLRQNQPAIRDWNGRARTIDHRCS